MNIKNLFLLTFILLQVKSAAHGQDTFFISKDCYKELQLRCNNKPEEVERIRIRRRLIKEDIRVLSEVQNYLHRADTNQLSDINNMGIVRINPYRKKNTDTLINVTELQLNYFSIIVYTTFIRGTLHSKMAVIKNASTFYCLSDGPEAPRNYYLIDPLFFEKHLKKNFRVNYFYYCNEIYLNHPSIFPPSNVSTS